MKPSAQSRVSIAAYVVPLAVLMPATAVMPLFAFERDNLSQTIAALAPIPAVIAWVLWLTLIYKMWDSLRGEPVIAPGLAVVLAIVPVINVFGITFSLLRFPGAFNTAMARRSVAEPRLATWMAVVVVALGFFVPAGFALGAALGSSYDTQTLRSVLVLLVGSGAIALYVLTLLLIARTCRGINAARASAPPR
ncbi:MAG: hypothetical protein HYV09_13690 [Deltaproteobacteria bacterium]|nr:hypothetical protein [Deltaproteobacteria bacterium]